MKKFLTTGVPIFDDWGEIKYIVSFPAIDIADISNFNQKYMVLNELVTRFTAEIERMEKTKSEFFGLTTNNTEMKKFLY